MPLVAAYESDSDEEIAPSDAVNAHHDAPPSGLSLPPPKRPAPQANDRLSLNQPHRRAQATKNHCLSARVMTKMRLQRVHTRS